MLMATVPPMGDLDQSRPKALIARLRITFPKAVPILHEGYAIVLFREADLSLEAVYDSLAGMLAGFEAAAAASDPFRDLMQARNAYRQCLLVHELAAREKLSGLITFSSVASKVLSQALERQRVGETIIDQRIRMLARGSSSPIETLEQLRCYLLCGCNVARAAKRLFMHRSTLDYRIARIENVLGCRLASLPNDEIERMVLSCTILLCRQ